MHTQSSFRLLVVRLGAMGDILHALPAVTALRRTHPYWHIGWVVDPRWQPLLTAATGTPEPSPVSPRTSATPIVDRIHLAHVRNWKLRPFSTQTVREIKSLRNELRSTGYDAVIDLQGAIRSAVIAHFSGCRRRIGEAHPREWPAHWLFTDRIATHGAHVIEQDIELAATIAADELAPVDPLLPVDVDAERWCDNWLAATFPGPSRPIALIVPGAGWGAKRWPPDRYAIVARGLAGCGFHVLANSGPGEEALAAPIVATGAATPLSVSLPQLIALTRRIALCIGGDTGPLHLASALNRPVVGIYGPTDPSRNGPFGMCARVLRSPGSRRDHSRRSAPDPGLLTITPDQVLHAAEELLAGEKME